MGYDRHFIPGCDLPLPELSSTLLASAFNAGAPIEHTRFSIVFSQSRGFAIATAHNIDGAAPRPSNPMPGRSFRMDPDVPRGIQVDNDRGYRNNPWDRGHLVRRFSLHFGDADEAREAVSQSDFWTNIAPQHEELHHTAWGKIEDWMLELADDADKRACVFTGPVLTTDDPEIVNRPGEAPIHIPAGFWKILAIKHEGQLKAAAFVTWQRDFDKSDPVEFDPILEQIRITTLEFLTALCFPALREADPLRFGAELIDAEVGRFAVREGSAKTRKAAVTCKHDISL